MAQTNIAHCLESNPRTEDVTIDENTTFESLMLQENVIKGLKDAGFKKPSPIQLKAIPIGRCGFDVIMKAKSGTGKTLVFSIIALESIDVKKKETQVLILTPTREIAVQIQEVLTAIGRYFEGLKVEYFIGGLPFEEDKKKCAKCHIAVGAPGRIKHLINEGFLKVASVHLFVLDEVDKLMEASFISDINEIFNRLRGRKQIITASATYPDGVSAALKKYMLSPTQIEIENNMPLLLGLRQFVKIILPYTSAAQEIKHKNEELISIFSTLTFTQCIIFTNYQSRTESISNFLEKNKWDSSYISSVRSQCQRLKTVKDLKDFNCKIMLSTDLTARGIDASKVDLIINYDVPIDTMTYLHRMGRAGRYGSTGVCIDFVSEDATLDKYKKILGAIGGCSMGVPKLPSFHGSIADLLKVSIPEENYIFGTVSDTSASNDVNTNIRKTIQTWTKVQKTNKPNSHKEKRDEETSKTVLSDSDMYCKNKALLYVTDILSRKKHDIDALKSDGDEVLHDYLQIIMRCDKDKVNNILNNTKHTNIVDILQNQIDSDVQESKTSDADVNSVDATFKISDNSAGKSNSEHGISDLSELKKLQKNLPISSTEYEEIQYEEESEYEEDEIEYEEEDLKYEGADYDEEEAEYEEDVEYEEEECDELNNVCDKDNEFLAAKQSTSNANRSDCNKEQEPQAYVPVKPAKDIDDDFLNNLFKVSYDCAIKSNSKHWTSCLPKSELKVLQHLIYKENHPLSSDEYEENEEEYDKDVNNAYELPSVTQFNSNNYNENPWTSPMTAEQLYFYFQKYGLEQVPTYFAQCSHNLWWNGLNFTTIEDFNNWFYYDWQAQVLNVRNYIQQKIYLEEMKNYQQNKK